MSINNHKNQILEEKFQEIEKTIPEKRSPIDFQTLEQMIDKWLLLEDKKIIKVLVGTIIANKLQGDPVWLFIIAPSGGTKTELIRGLSKIERIYTMSNLTAQTFLSGDSKRKDASLLLRIGKDNLTIFVLKDFTTILTMHRDKRHEILAQLREIYDGYYKKEFGTGETKEWRGKIGFIAGVTPVIDYHYSIYQALGERFIQYRLLQPEGFVVAKRAIQNRGKETEMRKEIQEAFANYFAGVEIPKEMPFIPKEMEDKIALLATFGATARSTVIRDSYSREVELIISPEMPTRLAKELTTLMSGFKIINSGEINEEDYQIIYKITLDGIPQLRNGIISLLDRANDYLETSTVAKTIGYPTSTTRRALEDLAGLKIVEREKQGEGRDDLWKLTDETRELLNKIKPNKTLPEKSGE